MGAVCVCVRVVVSSCDTISGGPMGVEGRGSLSFKGRINKEMSL